EMIRLDVGQRELTFANGVTRAYDYLITSMPLPRLIERMVDAPAHVRAAAKCLACTSCVTVNVGINAEGISPAQWRYFYDADFTFTRLSCPHLLSPHAVPPGHSAVQAEVYFSDKYKPLDRSPESYIEPVIRDLRRCGMIPESTDVVFREARVV